MDWFQIFSLLTSQLPTIGYSLSVRAEFLLVLLHVLCLWVNNKATMHYTRQELLDIRSSFAVTELSNNVKETIDSLGIGFAVLESRPIPCCISTVRCKRLAKQSGLNNNNLVDVPIDTISNHHESGLVVGVLNAQSTQNKTDRIRAAIIEHDVDILALTETWLTSTAKDEFFVKSLTLSGYKL